MKNPFYIVVEDEVSLQTVKTVIQKTLPNREFDFIDMNRGGRGNIKNKINDYNKKSSLFFFILVDLDDDKCPVLLKKSWLKNPERKNLIFRVAVREVESWLLADTDGFAQWLKISSDIVHKEAGSPEELLQPKEKLLSLVTRSKKKLKENLVQKENGYLRQGKAYNMQLIDYIQNYWNIEKAQKKSKSLEKTLKKLKKIFN